MFTKIKYVINLGNFKPLFLSFIKILFFLSRLAEPRQFGRSFLFLFPLLPLFLVGWSM